MTDSNESPLISIIITSYTMERFKDVCNLLDSVKSQTILTNPAVNSQQQAIRRQSRTSAPYSPPLEIIFVAERSKELYAKVGSYGKRIELPDFKVLFNDGEPGLSAARNVGILKAKGDVIAFVDDDTVLFPNWAEELAKGFDDSSVIGVTGPALPLWEEDKASWLPKEFTWLVSCTTWFDCNEKREVRNAWGMNMAFRKEAFQVCGPFLNQFGFHKGLFAEDNEFSLRVKARTGKKIIFCPEAKLWHRVHKYRLSLRFVKERAYWIGRSRRNLKRLHAHQEVDLLGTEYRLLQRIITHLLPTLVKDLFRNPLIARRRLTLVLTALFFMTLGYLLPPSRKGL